MLNVTGQTLTITLFAAMSLAGCGEATPTGQVVAIVNGEEVTVSELRAEAAARDVPDADDPATRSELLRAVVDRKLWVQGARRGKLDQQIEFVLARHRAEEVLLANLLIRTVGDAVEPPSDDDLNRFLQRSPAAFASRTVFQIDQIDFRPSDDHGVGERLTKASSLDEIDRLLTSTGIVSQRSRTEWNSMFMPAGLATKLRSQSPGKPFLHRDGEKIVAGVVIGKTDVPLSDNNRQVLARQNLSQQNLQAAVGKRLDEIRASAKISYKPGFAPADLIR